MDNNETHYKASFNDKDLFGSNCPHMIFDDHGQPNCLAVEDTAGLCKPELCPKQRGRNNMFYLKFCLGAMNIEQPH